MPDPESRKKLSFREIEPTTCLPRHQTNFSPLLEDPWQSPDCSHVLTDGQRTSITGKVLIPEDYGHTSINR